MAYLKVTKRGTIMVRGRMITSGTLLTKEHVVMYGWSKEEVDRLVQQGYLVRLGEQIDPDDYPAPPALEGPPLKAHPEEIDESKKGGLRGMTTGVSEKAHAPPPPPVVTSGGPWDLNPDALAGKSVEELNVMIFERAVDNPPEFETSEEAIAWLSQNFSGAESASVATQD